MSSRQSLFYKVGGGGPVANVLKADTSSGDAYPDKFLASSYSEIWIKFQVYIPQATLDAGGQWDIYDTFSAFQSVQYLYPSTNWSFNGHTTGGSGPVPLADQWVTIEAHSLSPSDEGELYINGSITPDASYNGTTSQDVSEFICGEYNGAGTNSIVYIKNISLGTTRGASDIFSEDFSTNDFSNWDAVVGNCTIIPDPFP